MPVPLLLFALFAVAAWGSALVHALMLIGYRKEDTTVLMLLTSGIKFFDKTTFTYEGRHVHRRFLLSTGALFACVVLGIGFVVLRTAKSN